jgi:PhnB protein
MAKAKRAVPEGLHTVTPSLVLDDTSKAIDFYKRAFGATEVARAVGPDGKIMHAEISIGNSHVMMNDAMMGAKSPHTLHGSPVTLWVYVDDADALYNRATSAGAKPAQGPMGKMADQFWGDRCGSVIDPEGYTWTIATRKEDLTPQEMKQRQDAWMEKFATQAAHT